MDKLLLTSVVQRFVRPRDLVIDGVIFRFHHRITSSMLIVFSLLVSATQFIGNPIQCMEKENIPVKLLNTYCWVEGTFTLPKAHYKIVGKEIVYPGVDTYEPNDEIMVHSYYQWVCFMLLFQAALFLVPVLFWRSWEGNRMKNLLQELDNAVVPDDERKKRFQHLIYYFRTSMHHHSAYAFKYHFCEVIALVNLVGQIYFVDSFLGGEFTRYGLEVISFSNSVQDNRIDPMVRIFPRLTKCTFREYGSSGDVKKLDTLCLLPLNIVNEKIYITLWFWFIILTVLSLVTVIYRALLLGIPTLRHHVLQRVAGLAPRRQLKSVLSRTTYGDWFVLFLLAQNMEVLNFRDFLIELSREFEPPLLVEKTDSSIVV